MKNPTISFYTFGCRLNQSETAVVEQTFESAGYQLVSIKTPADIVVINTCTVTEGGDTDTRRLVNKINQLNPKSQIALIGCQAQIQKERLTEMSNIRWVVGTAKKMDLLSVIEKSSISKKPEVIIPRIPKNTFTQPTAAIDRRHTRANLKIQDGCDFFCSYCEIPYARGRARSRLFTDIVKEANDLANAGHKELVITGINVGTYKQNFKTIVDVIQALQDIDKIKRIRVSSIEPTTIPDKILKMMAGPTKLCRHLHIPLQTANNSLLKLMKRKYAFEEFRIFIEKAHDQVKDICIGTDVIVGFPQETDEKYQETLDKVKDLPVDYLHVFSYSVRNLAKSNKLACGITPNEIQKRSKQLRELSIRKRRLFYESLIGKDVDVLFEQKKKDAWFGLTDHYARVKVFSSAPLSNQFLKVHCTSIDHKDLVGTVIRSNTDH